jgi:hypothetical protein
LTKLNFSPAVLEGKRTGFFGKVRGEKKRGKYGKRHAGVRNGRLLTPYMKKF